MHASNLLKAVLKPRSLRVNSSRRSGTGDGASSRRSLSPDNRLPAASLSTKKSLTPAAPVKMTCMCSPTNHPGSFRCRFHREQKQSRVVAMVTSPRRGRSSAASSAVEKVQESDGVNILSEVNRTLPGRPLITSRSCSGRTSRLKHMISERDLEVDDLSVSSFNEERLNDLNVPRSSISFDCLPGTRRPSANLLFDLPREIPTLFCQSTSKKALDVFDRSMTRMYL